MAAIDFRKDHRKLYSPSAKEVSIEKVPAMNFLMVDGSGNPNTAPEYAEAVEALYALSYGVKFAVRKSDGGIDYAVMPHSAWCIVDRAVFVYNHTRSIHP